MSMIKIGILTSSRADFGIYEPLLKLLNAHESIDSSIIVFGTHLSSLHGNSISHVEKLGMPILARFDTAPIEDSPSAISLSMALVMQKLTTIWVENNFDLVIALGDRYEMFAAVASALPFNIKIAHIHGGETTLGAIDNAMRHSITHMSSLHFTAAEAYKQRVIELIGKKHGVYNTGALSIDNLISVDFITKDEILSTYNIILDKPTLLITLHPESIGYERNANYTSEMLIALGNFNTTQQIITMPNADTSGLVIRNLINEYAIDKPNVFIIENFGSRAYLSVMKHCTMMVGNTSSGFIEAAYFPKWVVNVGDRQKGRIRTPNIIDVEFDHDLISRAITKALNEPVPDVPKIYGQGDAASKILKIILDEYDID